MQFFILGVQPSTASVITLATKAFATLEEAEHYMKSVSPAWKPFVVMEVLINQEESEAVK